MPGFSGVNKDRKYLYQRLMKEWKRHHKNSEERPSIPRITWLRKIQRKKVTQIQRFIGEMTKHDRTAAEQMRQYLANRKARGNRSGEVVANQPETSTKKKNILKRFLNR
jgi:hypothetical protein